MAVTTTRAADFEDAFIAQLKQRPGLYGVQVDVGPLGDDSGREYIQTIGEPGPLTGTQEWGSLGNRRRDEHVTIRGEIYVEKPGAGASVIRAARDRALELLAEVEAQLRDDPKVDQIARQAALTGWTERRGLRSSTRQSVIDFTIEYEASLPRT